MPAFLQGGGDTGAALRDLDWSTTPLGDPDRWPVALKTLVELALNSKQPMLIVWGPERTTLYNDGYAAMCGSKHPAALGRPFDELWAEIWDQVEPIIAATYAGESIHRDHIQFTMLRNGFPEETHFAFGYTPVRDHDGRVAGMFCACTELTEQVFAARRAAQANAALAESEIRFRTMADESPVMVWVTDASGAATYLNRAWHEFTGQTTEEALGFGWLDATHPDDRPQTEEAFRGANARREAFRLEYRLRDAAGAYRWMIDAAAPRLAADGGFLGFIGSVIDIHERREAEERERLLAREVDHRAKNLLAIVQSVLQLTRAEDVTAFKAAVSGRIQSLARAHGLLAASRWAAVDLRRLVVDELAAYASDDAMRLSISGPPLRLKPPAAQAMALLLHELATNAVKHGALSAAEGRLAVTWRLDQQRHCVRLRWSERGGPRIAGPPQRRGFGSAVMATSVERQLEGEMALSWLPEGVECDLSIPTSQILLAPPGSPRPPEAGGPAAGAGIGGAQGRIMVVEDEALIGMIIEDVLRAAGYEVIGPAARVSEAMALLQRDPPPDAALLDVNLAEERSIPLAKVLRARGIPLAFCTGYGEIADLPPECAGAPIIRKPAAEAEILRVVAQLLDPLED